MRMYKEFCRCQSPLPKMLEKNKEAIAVVQLLWEGICQGRRTARCTLTLLCIACNSHMWCVGLCAVTLGQQMPGPGARARICGEGRMDQLCRMLLRGSDEAWECPWGLARGDDECACFGAMKGGAARWEEAGGEQVGGRPRWAAGGDAELQEIFSDVSCQWLCRKFGFRRGSERA